MIRDALFIARKDVTYMLLAKETLLWVFLMPLLFFFFIGSATSGFRPDPAKRDELALRGGKEGDFLVDQLVRRLEERDYRVVRPSTDEEFDAHSRRLTLPPAFADSVRAGVPVQVRFEHERTGFGSDYESVRVNRAIYTVLADLIVTATPGEGPSAQKFAELAEMPRALTLEVVSAGKRERIPSGFEQAIPGTLVMFTLLVMTTSGAVLLVIERRQGLLRRLASTPIRRLSIVLGKWAGKLALGLVQIGFGMIAGSVLFQMDWGPNLGMVLAVMLAYASLMATLGIVLGSLSRTEGQAVGIGVISANALGALGGCWWPIEITAEWMQKLQLFLPTGWAMDALHKLVSFAAGPASAIPHVVGMSLATIVLLLVSGRIFRFE